MLFLQSNMCNLPCIFISLKDRVWLLLWQNFISIKKVLLKLYGKFGFTQDMINYNERRIEMTTKRIPASPASRSIVMDQDSEEDLSSYRYDPDEELMELD